MGGGQSRQDAFDFRRTFHFAKDFLEIKSLFERFISHERLIFRPFIGTEVYPLHLGYRSKAGPNYVMHPNRGSAASETFLPRQGYRWRSWVKTLIRDGLGAIVEQLSQLFVGWHYIFNSPAGAFIQSGELVATKDVAVRKMASEMVE